ncbi:MAG: hypothetical protein HY674_05800 [Chloroflexi bacterium]|nr:hypothetical protein [Chloroflexota bacterium]
MASEFDESDFVDRDFQAAQKSPYATSALAAPPPGFNRPPTPEELESKVSETHQKLAELKRAQEELQRERAALEETRRRRLEFQTGRSEMQQHLTRGVGLLEEAEFAARREAEQMAKTLTGLREALDKVQAINEETWTQDTCSLELTRALTILDNARMEWNAARLKWPLLDQAPLAGAGGQEEASAPANSPLESRSFWQLCRLGLALTWPVALVGLLGLGAITVILLLR